jgi:tRNA nucleotidyltransferase (CCA-adding enzyme)
MRSAIAPIPISKELSSILAGLPKSYLVGGCVRDHILGLTPKDLDIEVYGMSYAELEQVLQKHGKVDLVGKSFGVIKLSLPGEKAPYDFSLARRDNKMPDKAGHKAFKIDIDSSITEAEGAARRDLTINSLMYDPRTSEILDYYGGLNDLKERRLKHTSPQFAEDPLRALRVVQFASRFDFNVDPSTIELCRQLSPEFKTLPKERVGEEFNKMLLKGSSRLKGLQLLKEIGWLKHFPELNALDGLPQDPEWHPEGDALTHTGHTMDAMAQLPKWKALPEQERLTYMYGIMCHDLGKATTTRKEFKKSANREAIVSPGHDKAGAAPTKSLLARLNVPLAMVRRVIPLVEHHMDHLQVSKDSQIRKLAVDLAPDNIFGLGLIVEADHSGRPPLKPEQPKEMQYIVDRAKELGCDKDRPQPILLGRHIAEWSALPPSRAYGVLTTAAYEAQINGAIKSEEDAKTWFKHNRGKILENAKLAPERIISGGDLVTAGFPTGPQLGKLQRELFERQLDGAIKTREDAIVFLKDQQSTYSVPDTVLENLKGLSLQQVLSKASRTTKIGQEILTSPDPVAQDILASHSFQATQQTLIDENIKFTGKVLGAGVGSIVLETLNRKAARIGLGPVTERPDIPEVLPVRSKQHGDIRIDYSAIVKPVTDRLKLEEFKAKLQKKGYDVTPELDLDNIGETDTGYIVIIDPGAIPVKQPILPEPPPSPEL